MLLSIFYFIRFFVVVFIIFIISRGGEDQAPAIKIAADESSNSSAFFMIQSRSSRNFVDLAHLVDIYLYVILFVKNSKELAETMNQQP